MMERFWGGQKSQATTVNNTSAANTTSVEHNVSAPEQKLYSTDGEIGLMIWSDPKDADVDIVFVHGLTGNRVNTWTHKESQILWPKDLLAKDLDTARIVTFGYDADIVNALDTASASSNTLRDHGNTLTHDLARRRWMTKSSTRPLIFVAHSLGGLVVEQALLNSAQAAESWMKATFQSTCGIIFMGTPHHGSDKAKWGSILTRLSSIVRQTNRPLVGVLDPGSEMLASLQQQFYILLDNYAKNYRKDLKIFCFFEELAIVGVGKVLSSSSPFHTHAHSTLTDEIQIVESSSAIVPGYQAESIHATHTGMTKFTGKTDPGYDKVSGQLSIWCSELPAPAPAAEAPSQAASSEEVRNRRVEKFAQFQPERSTQQWSGTVNSNGGVILQGNPSAGGDMRFG